MSKCISIFLLILLVCSKHSFANCNDILKLEISKRLGTNDFLFSSEIQELFEIRDERLRSNFALYGSKFSMLTNKRSLSSKRLTKLLESKELDLKIKHILFLMRNNIHSKDKIQAWALHLYNDVVVEMYLAADFFDIAAFQMDGKIQEKYIIKVILERSKRGGFSGEKESLVSLEDELIDEDFLSILKSRKLIYDISFETFNHGHLIHILQIDFLIYSLKKASLNTLLASEIYVWFGNNEKIKVDGYEYSAINAWEALFDSFERDFSSPEKLNPILKEYFLWTKEELAVH